MIYDNRQFYIDGAWVDPVEPKDFHVINPATEAVAGTISMGGPKDVDRAVAAARRAFDGYSRTTPAERLALEYPEAGGMVAVPMLVVVTFARAVGREAQCL